MSKVLVAFANPRGSIPLRLSTEDRAIHEAIRLSKNRDNIVLTVRHAVTVHDLRRALLDDDYRIVQISGHGTGIGLILEDDMGGRFIVPQQALADLFHAYSHPKGKLECVILNACYSLSQGQIISLGVPYTIAMESPISNNAAIEFSRGFYDAIGAGRDIGFAYDEGCRTVKLATPNLIWNSRLLKKDEIYTADSLTREDIGELKSSKNDIKALVGLAVDVSGSMAQNIQNNTGGQLSRLESFRQSLERLTNEARNTIQESRTKKFETSIDLFAYGFGLRSIAVCDLLSLIKVGQHIISRDEIEELKNRYTREMRSRYSGYEGLGDLARQFGFGGLVREAESVVRANAEAEIRRRIMLEVKSRLETQLNKVGNTTLSMEEVAQLWGSSGETLSNAEELIYGNTPMREALTQVKERFQRELKKRPKDTTSVLFILSDGEPTDGDPLPTVQALKSLGVMVISCFVTDQDIANPRILFGKPEKQWNNGAKLMFNMASDVEDESDFAKFLLKKEWKINPQAKFFVQVNHSEILEEFISVVLSPLEERELAGALPRGI